MNTISGQANAACCAHLKVYWTTQSKDGGQTRGWWQCGECWQRFIPQIDFQISTGGFPGTTGGAPQIYGT